MNIFISSDLYSEYFIINELHAILETIDLTQCTILTTDRYYDKKFIQYAILKGAEVKIYNISTFLTDEIIMKIAGEIDFLILFSDMSNFFFRKLFAICDSTVYIKGERTSLHTYGKTLYKAYNEYVEHLYATGKSRQEDLVKLFDDMYVNKLIQAKRVPIHVIT